MLTCAVVQDGTAVETLAQLLRAIPSSGAAVEHTHRQQALNWVVGKPISSGWDACLCLEDCTTSQQVARRAEAVLRQCWLRVTAEAKELQHDVVKAALLWQSPFL